MKKLVITALTLALLSPFVLVSLTKAADTGSVTATVTAQQVAITVTDGSVAYGVLALSGTTSTTSTGVNDTQTATNAGNVSENLNIKGANSSGGWTLAATIGSEQYKHEFCVTGAGTPDLCDTSPVWTVLTTNDQEMVHEVTSSGTQKFDLKVTVPSATAQTGSQNVNVTVTAVAH